MKTMVIAAALLAVSASAHAGTYSYQGVTIHVQDGCRSSSCVAVYAPGYGYYHGGHQVKEHKAPKDAARMASTREADVTGAALIPPMEATPLKTPETTLQATPSDLAPAK